MSSFDPAINPVSSNGSVHKGGTHHVPTPETIVGAEGTSKRNILRKGKRRGGGGGKREVDVDDGSNYVEEGGALDEHDPNYDSEEETGSEYIPVTNSAHNGFVASSSSFDNGEDTMTLTKYKKCIQPIIEEYFLNAEVDDVKKSLEELNAHQFSYEFVKRIITTSMDRSDKERELTSRLLSEFYPDVLSTNVIGKGFERLFELMNEIEKDAPFARDFTATFIARCVVDEILPPSFLADAVVCSLGGDIIDHAKRMLSREHMGARLERAWGPGDGRPVSEMKVDVDLLLQEYMLSRDVIEASKCIKQLNAPHFNHEVVKRAITASFDKTHDDRVAVRTLLNHLLSEDIISPQQMQMGFQLVNERLFDIVLDVPAARTLFEEFVADGKGKLVSAEFVVSSA